MMMPKQMLTMMCRWLLKMLLLTTKKAASADEPIDPIASRRAAELAELQEIEAIEERRRSEENKKHVDAQAARNQTNIYASA